VQEGTCSEEEQEIIENLINEYKKEVEVKENISDWRRKNYRNKTQDRRKVITENQNQENMNKGKIVQRGPQERASHVEDMLGLILERLERLEKDREKNGVEQPNRS